jgi:hypothetical protein
MQPWSDDPIHEDFRVKFFVDTNLLVYLVDHTYENLNDFIDILNESKFAVIFSSKFVLFEFVGVRKREHYLRIAAANSKKTKNGETNLSSLFKYRDSYDAPNTAFDQVAPDIKRLVNEDIEKIKSEFLIDLDNNSLHEDQLLPTFDVCLTSKISNQDSLVLVSSVLPLKKVVNENVIVLTNDGMFVSSCQSGNIAQTLATHSIAAPEIMSIDSIPNQIRLKENIDKATLKSRTYSFLLDLITKKLQKRFLGKTFTPDSPNFPADCVCFKLTEACTITESMYISVVGKDLDFVYTTKKKVSLWHNGAALPGGFTSPVDNKINVAYKIVEVLDDGKDGSPIAEVINALRANNNLVFVHPDS